MAAAPSPTPARPPYKTTARKPPRFWSRRFWPRAVAHLEHRRSETIQEHQPQERQARLYIPPRPAGGAGWARLQEQIRRNRRWAAITAATTRSKIGVRTATKRPERPTSKPAPTITTTTTASPPESRGCRVHRQLHVEIPAVPPPQNPAPPDEGGTPRRCNRLLAAAAGPLQVVLHPQHEAMECR